MLSKLFDEFQEIHSKNIQMMKELAENGWFISPFEESGNLEFLFQHSVDFKKYDTDMIAYMNLIYQKLKEKTLKKFDKRKHILEVAFNLHENRNYIAAIPLFLSQIDGLCAIQFKSFLFSEHEERKTEIKKEIERYPLLRFIIEPMLTPLQSDTQFSASISKCSLSKKAKGPNRNGILHGSRKHLDYGTEINSYKCLSLLFYMVEIIEEGN